MQNATHTEVFSPLKKGQQLRKIRKEASHWATENRMSNLGTDEVTRQRIFDEYFPIYAHLQINLDRLIQKYKEGRIRDAYFRDKSSRLQTKIDQVVAACRENRPKRKYQISPLRQSVIESIIKQPYKIMLTLSFVKPRSDEEALSDLWYLITQINKRIWRRGWSKHRKNGLLGRVIGEPHIYSWEFRGRLHFHVLLTEQPEIEDVDLFEEFVRGQIPHVLDRAGQPVMDIASADVTEVYNLKELAVYLTKSMEHPQFASGDYVMPLHPRGIDGISVRSRKDALYY